MSDSAFVWRAYERLEAAVSSLFPVWNQANTSVLEDPPDGLADLRGVLARDHRDRLDR